MRPPDWHRRRADELEEFVAINGDPGVALVPLLELARGHRNLAKLIEARARTGVVTFQQPYDEDQLTALVQGFKGKALYPIVAVAAFTGARSNEIPAFRWSDLCFKTKELTIERALEDTKKYGRGVKEPRRTKHKRTIEIDDALVELLCAEHDRCLRPVAGVPDDADVDLSLVKLPAEALMFPGGDYTDPTKLRHPDAVTRNFEKRARKLGLKLRFHDLRVTHETLRLQAGVAVHVVAKRCGQTPEVVLKHYAKVTRRANANAAAVTGALSKSVLA